MPMRQRLLFTCALLVVLGLARPSWAQYSSTLEGTVSDQSGAVVPGATVTTSNEARLHRRDRRRLDLGNLFDRVTVELEQHDRFALCGVE